MGILCQQLMLRSEAIRVDISRYIHILEWRQWANCRRPQWSKSDSRRCPRRAPENTSIFYCWIISASTPRWTANTFLWDGFGGIGATLFRLWRVCLWHIDWVWRHLCWWWCSSLPSLQRALTDWQCGAGGKEEGGGGMQCCVGVFAFWLLGRKLAGSWVVKWVESINSSY